MPTDVTLGLACPFCVSFVAGVYLLCRWRLNPSPVCNQRLQQHRASVSALGRGSCANLFVFGMRGAAAAAILVLSGASADICTGKPRTVAELREQWFGGPAHVWPRRNTTSYDKRTRPNLAQRWDGRDTDAEAGKPPKAGADAVWAVLQVRA